MGLRLALFTDQVTQANGAIDQRLLGLMATTNPRIGYVASAPDPDRAYFSSKREYYARLGVDLRPYVDEWTAGDRAGLRDLLDCDAIHLSGGNPYRFLRWLKATGLLVALREFALDGGVLVGNSGGSLLMTGDISFAALSPFGRSERSDSVDALALVDFQFWPHYQPGQERESNASRLLAAAPAVYACPDGSGIIVEGASIQTFGNPKLFRHGREHPCP